ncbi:MAG: hypothetical protein U0163_05735 [Gemmatimonadaceae bacterium]
MDAQVLLTVVSPLVAITAILGAVRLASRGQRDASIRSRTDAIAALADSDYDFQPGEIAIATDGRSAVLSDARDPSHVAVAHVVGVCIAARVLSRDEVHAISWLESNGEKTAKVRLWDMGCPVIELHLSSSDAARWRSRLDALASSNVSA